jgi:hypothetical protein
VDSDERRQVEHLIERLREHTKRLKEQVDAMRELYTASRRQFLGRRSDDCKPTDTE